MLTVRIGDLNQPTGAFKCATENKDWREFRSFLETGAKKGNGEFIATTKLCFDPTKRSHPKGRLMVRRPRIEPGSKRWKRSNEGKK